MQNQAAGTERTPPNEDDDDMRDFNFDEAHQREISSNEKLAINQKMSSMYRSNQLINGKPILAQKLNFDVNNHNYQSTTRMNNSTGIYSQGIQQEETKYTSGALPKQNSWNLLPFEKFKELAISTLGFKQEQSMPPPARHRNTLHNGQRNNLRSDLITGTEMLPRQPQSKTPRVTQIPSNL